MSELIGSAPDVIAGPGQAMNAIGGSHGHGLLAGSLEQILPPVEADHDYLPDRHSGQIGSGDIAYGFGRVIGRCPYVDMPQNEIEAYFRPSDSAQGETALARKIITFCRQQYATWGEYRNRVNVFRRDMRQASLALDDTEYAHIDIVYPPGRDRNNAVEDKTQAATTEKPPQTVALPDRQPGGVEQIEKPCFLCSKPDDNQRALKYTDKAWILANPFPIIRDNHLTITMEHTPQRWDEVADSAFALAGDLGNDWVVFYNGARVGASAPKHAHIQAGRIRLPIESDAKKAWLDRDMPGVVEQVHLRDDVQAFVPRKLGRSVLVINGQNPDSVRQAVGEAITKLPKYDEHEEPDINVVIKQGSDEEGNRIFTAYLFPRRAFRAKSFSKDGNPSEIDKFAIGIASLELAGILAVTLMNDYKKLVTLSENSQQGERTGPQIDRVAPENLRRVRGAIRQMFADVSPDIDKFIGNLQSAA